MHIHTWFLSLVLLQIHASPTPQASLPAFFTNPHYFTTPISSTPESLESLFNLTSPIAPPTNGPKPPPTKRALQLQYILCNIILDGRNQGNYQNFLITGGQILITTGITTSATTNGRNPLEVVFVVGDPYIAPLAGSLRYTTNHYLNRFIGGFSLFATLLDFAFVSSTTNSVTVSVDSRLAAANSLSGFNDRTYPLRVATPVFLVYSGGFKVVISPNGAVSGTVALGGHNYIGGAVGQYKAVISGTVIKRDTAVF
jgi:hypothetical protein